MGDDNLEMDEFDQHHICDIANCNMDLLVELNAHDELHNFRVISDKIGEFRDILQTELDGGQSSQNAANNVSEVLVENENVANAKNDELECIQSDLNDLVEQLNNFISESDANYLYSSEDSEYHTFEDDDTVTIESGTEDENASYDSEKQDGPPEKEQQFYVPDDTISFDSFYVTDGINPPEINWDVLAPFIQSTVADLQKLRNLNLKTSNIMRKIKHIAEDNALDEINGNDLNNDEICNKRKLMISY